MVSFAAFAKTINDINEVEQYFTNDCWVVWDLDGTLFLFENDIPSQWLTPDTKKVFNASCLKTKKVISVTGSYSYLYQEINEALNKLKATFSASKKNVVEPLNKDLKSFTYNGVCFSGLQTKGDTLVQHLKTYDTKEFPKNIVFIDDTEKHTKTVSEAMQKAFPSIVVTCLFYQK